MRIILDTYIGLYFKVQNKLPIFSLKVIGMIRTQKQKSYKDTSLRMLPRSKMTR